MAVSTLRRALVCFALLTVTVQATDSGHQRDPIQPVAVTAPRARHVTHAVARTATVKPPLAQAFERLPWHFEQNIGQADPSCQFSSSARGYGICVGPAGLELQLRVPRDDRGSPRDAGKSIRLTFEGAVAGSFTGDGKLPGTANVIVGTDSSRWMTGIPTYRRVVRKDLYSGIDIVVYGNGRDVEYDLVVAPQADPAAIRVSVEGAVPRIDADGNVALDTPEGIVRLRAPHVYQEIAGERRDVAAAYELTASGIGFRLDTFERGHALVIDPVISFATYVGGMDNDLTSGIAVDSSGNTYIVAMSFRGTPDILVTKLDPTGRTIVYSTYLGGNGLDAPVGVAVDAEGHAFIAGYTQSANFPTYRALQPSPTGIQSVILTKLSLDGTGLEFSTHFGEGIARGIAVDAMQNVWIAGSDSLPTKSSLYDTGPVVAKISGTGAVVHFGTRLGGSGLTVIRDISVDASGAVYAVGGTTATNLPVVNAHQPAFAGGASDGFVMKLTSEVSTESLLEDTFDAENLGEPASAVPDLSAWNISSGSIDLVEAPSTGLAARASADSSSARIESRFPVTLSGAGSIFTAANGIAYRLELDVIGPPGPLGGELVVEVGTAFAETLSIPGRGALTHVSRDFIVSDTMTGRVAIEWPAGTNPPALDDVRLSRVRERPALAYATYFGASGGDVVTKAAAEPSGVVHLAGFTSSSDFPVVGGFQTALQGGASDAFVARLDPQGVALFSTLLGGSADDEGNGVAVDRDGNTLVVGHTLSTDFPVLNAVQENKAGGWDSFVTKIRADGTLAYSTYIGGNDYDWMPNVATDRDGSAYVVMQSTSTDHRTINAAQAHHAGANDAFIVKLTDTAELRAFGLTQARGGNTGRVTIRILGANFVAGPVTVTLVGHGGPDVVAESAVVDDSGSITATFDLFAVPPGVRDVVVRFADGRTLTLEAAFTIESGGEPHVWVDVVGRRTIRQGVTTTYYVVVGNQGTVDAPAVGITVVVPSTGVVIQPAFTFAETPAPGRVLPDIVRGDERIVPLLLPVVPAGATVTLPFTVTSNRPEFAIGVEIERWILDVRRPWRPENSRKAFECVLGGASFGLTAAGLAANGARALALGILEKYFSFAGEAAQWPGEPIMITDELDGIVSDLTGADDGVRSVVVSGLFSALPAIEACADIFDQLRQPFSIETVGSFDPNEKNGPPGAGSQAYVSSQQPLRYAVHFENLATATAPAATVIIEDRLDASIVDPASVVFGAVAFGSRIITPPTGATFTADVDLRPEKNLVVRVRATANATSGVVRWELTSIDPLTGQPTDDPLAGFLPPNQDGREGTGSVLFTVRPRPSLPAGAEITNQASITFDANAAIDTNVWVNTIDDTLPVSEVHSMAVEQTSGRFAVSWAGTDSGSQIRDFSIWVAEDDGPSYPWIVATASTSAIFEGQYGHRYSFYSIARDAAGNVEASPGTPDASVVVVDRDAPTIVCAGPDAAWHASDVSVPCEAIDAGSGLASAEDGVFQLMTAVPPGVETPAAVTETRGVCDVSGNCATAGPVGPIRIDRKVPLLATSGLPDSPVVLNAMVPVTYSCVDAGSGVASCVGSSPSGSSIDTSQIGTRQFSLKASDLVGNSSTHTAAYVVGYAVCVDYDPMKAHRSGSTIPLKLHLCDAAGLNVSSDLVTVTALSVTRVGDAVSADISDAGNANPDANFRFADGSYIFNLRLTGYPSGTYAMEFRAGVDPTRHVVHFQVR